MDIFKFFLTLIPVFAAGWSVLVLLLKGEIRFTAVEKGALAFGVGWGLVTLEMFAFSLWGVPWDARYLSLPWLLLLPLSVWKWKKGDRNFPTHVKASFLPEETAAVLFLTFLFWYVVLEALAFPLFVPDYWDAWSIWGFKAKAFYLSRSVTPLFRDYYPLYDNTHFSHPGYPLLLPLAETWVYLGLGKVDEQTVKLLFPLIAFIFPTTFIILFGPIFIKNLPILERLMR